MLSRRSPLAALALAAIASIVPSSARAGDASPPRLVLVLSIDQLRPERISPALPGAFGRLLREGRSFADAAHDHADTETCPGHAVMLTGVHPGRAGVPANDFVARDSGRTIYCVEDAAKDARVIGALDMPRRRLRPGDGVTGRSPRLLRAMRSATDSGAGQVPRFSVSGKDRAAIMRGRRPDAAYWMDRGALGFSTSRYYLDAPPAWAAWHGDADGQSLLARARALGTRDGFAGERRARGRCGRRIVAFGGSATSVLGADRRATPSASRSRCGSTR